MKSAPLALNLVTLPNHYLLPPSMRNVIHAVGQSNDSLPEAMILH